MPLKPPRSEERREEQARMGARFRNVREELGWSQAEAAEAMGFTSSSTVSAIERGINGIDALDLWHYARASGYPIQYFVDSTFSSKAPAWPRTKLEWQYLAGGDERRAEAHFAIERMFPSLSNQ